MQCLTWFEPDEVALRAMLVRWVIAYPRAVMCHIRVDNDLATELKVRSHPSFPRPPMHFVPWFQRKKVYIHGGEFRRI